MLRRWLIRSIFMLSILLCVVGWGWSGWYGFLWSDVGLHRHIDCGTQSGDVFVRIWWRGTLSLPDRGSVCFANSYGRLWPIRGPRYYRSDGAPGRTDELYIPYWVILVPSVLLLIFFWRATRPRKPAGAFPVVMAAKKETP